MNNRRYGFYGNGDSDPESGGTAQEMVRYCSEIIAMDKVPLRRNPEVAALANQAKPDFMATMSHEIRTPLNAMLGMLKLALQTELTAEQTEYLSLMKDAGNSLLAIVNGILDHSRIEADQLELEQLPFSLRGCLDNTVRMLDHEARKKGLNLVCSVAPEIPDDVLGDPMRLRQILVNLLGNAIKFTEHGDIAVRVTLRGVTAGGLSCRFSVSDQGIGIPAEEQASIFTPYRQVDRSIARRYGGSGLGLSISARLVQLMNGNIWVDSTPGLGSTFHFTACFGRPAAVARCWQEIRPGQPTTATPLNILLVEDNATNRRLSQITLEKAGHRVLLADSGAKARAVLERERPDLILMDIQMPDMDGLQTTAAIRCQESLLGGHLPIVALTAHALPQDRTRCLQAGMDDYLTKPVDPEELLACIERLGKQPGRIPARSRRGSVLDRDTLLFQVHGDLHLLGEIRDIFLRDCGPLMAGLRQALNSHDEARFNQLAHTLRGMFRSLAAEAAEEVAGQLEEGGIDQARAAVTYARLEHEVKALKINLQAMLRTGKNSRPGGAHFSQPGRRSASPPPLAAVKDKARRLWQGMPHATWRNAERRFAQHSTIKGEAR